MKNTDFYAYCCDNRKTEPDPNKKQALTEVYGFMREYGVTKGGVKRFVDSMMYMKRDDAARVAAYQWLQGVFDGPFEPVQTDGQMQLFWNEEER